MTGRRASAHREKGWGMRGFLVALTLSLGLAACETTSTSGEFASASEVLAASPASDPIALYAVEAAPGTAGTVLASSGNSTLVHVGPDYVSATGDRCRRVILADGNGRSQVSAVCLVEQSWKTVIGL
ncbi:hypothetical protein [Parvibaculum sp.]|uniref:hypothetical protein n=1 Tax=Parvibaculum sp. TaxID=2024848 RepID=UPI001D4F55EC|nr:hypothetical protein [Parvibaculum sp.]MBX3490799.1 hypothetical protein [Parvibaculum sp.]MCW5728703.1 hypothetical protein [Parvibaculum sp.]